MIKLLLGIRKVVGGVVAFILMWMVGLALLQLLLRWMFFMGIPWIDVHLRHLLLWICLLGGALATAHNRHIRIDLVEHYLNKTTKLIVQRIGSFASAGITFYLGYLSKNFVQSEREADSVLDHFFFQFSPPLWILELVIPLGFGLMGLFFLVMAVAPHGLAPEGKQH